MYIHTHLFTYLYLSLSLSIYMYIYVSIYIYIYIYNLIFILNLCKFRRNMSYTYERMHASKSTKHIDTNRSTHIHRYMYI